MVKVHFDTDTNKWIEKDTPTSLYLDGYLKEKLDNVKKIVRKNFDATILIVGNEGSGKSTLSFIIGQYLDDMGLTIHNIAEGSADALTKLESMPDHSVLICDEAELLFSSRETMTREQRQLTQVMKVIRQKNMILILVTPVFFDLAQYIAVSRSLFLLRTYTDKNFNRGGFAYWGKRKKLKLFHEGKKRLGSYAKPKPDFYGRFTDYLPPFNDDYLKLKARSLKEAFDGKEKLSERANERVKASVKDEIALEIMKENPEMPLKDLATMFKVTIRHLKYIRDGV